MSYTHQQIQDTLKIVNSSILNCEKIQPKLKPGSPQLSLSNNRIKALRIAQALLLQQEEHFTKMELENAITQITSIKNKSTTGLHNATAGSGTYTRFSRINEAMDVVLDYLKQALD